MSSTCLVVKLGKAGFDPDCLEQLERADLLEAMAETMLAEPTVETETDFIREAREAPQVPLLARDSNGTASEGGSAAVRLRELKLEEKRAEREERQAEREERRAAREAKKGRLLERPTPRNSHWRLNREGSRLRKGGSSGKRDGGN